jgi:hypothetical protein
MKKLLLLSCVFAFCGCTHNEETINWIATAKKPVVIKLYNTAFLKNNRYTLIDANGNIYDTGWTSLALPDTINVTAVDSIH